MSQQKDLLREMAAAHITLVRGPSERMKLDYKPLRLAAGGEWIRNFSSAMPRHRQQRGRLHFGGEWRLLGPPLDNYRYAEAGNCSDDRCAADRSQLGRTHETVAYLARN
jgi:hypothetical protein